MTTPPSKDDIAAAYGAIYAAPDKTLDTGLAIRYDLPELKRDFAEAGRGKDVVNGRFIKSLTGHDVHLIRSKDWEDEPASLSDATKSITKLAMQTPYLDQANGPIQQELQNEISAIARQGGINKDALGNWVQTVVHAIGEDNDKKPLQFGSDPSDPLAQKIAYGLEKKKILGTLPKGENDDLDDALNRYSTEKNLTPAQLADQVVAFNSAVDARHDKMQSIFQGGLDDISAMKYSSGLSWSSEQSSKFDYMAVPAVKGNGFVSRFGDPSDLPPLRPPITQEQEIFLIALHESTHEALKMEPGLKGMTNEAKAQGNEIRADATVIKYLNDTEDFATKNYLLSMRNVTALKAEVQGKGYDDNVFSHDTASFIRIQEATGHALDLDRYQAEKGGLVDRIREQSPAWLTLTTSDLMRSVQKVLQADAVETDPAKKLTPLQQMEAKSFLQDAQGLGYVPGKDPAPLPQPSSAPATVKQNYGAPSV